uniref:DH domain-containing protein n=1 Tax=Pseudonaja textilis TaxID=8673 RepID=A0A670YBK9_PSETE
FNDLVKIHRTLTQDIYESIVSKNDQNLYKIFISYKERLVIYGQYCSQVETAISCLDIISKTKEDVKLKLEECSKRANNGKFTLRDLLVVPMQRVLKYHLLLQELVKHTNDITEKANLKLALDAMKDLAQYVNEVKRDNETLREIKQFQSSIENLNQSLLLYGRPQGDGEIKITTLDKRHYISFQLRKIILERALVDRLDDKDNPIGLLSVSIDHSKLSALKIFFNISKVSRYTIIQKSIKIK